MYKHSHMYFALSVVMINMVKINCKPVILALVDAHLSFLDMWRHRATQILVNMRSDNGLLPEGTKPLSDLMLTYHTQYSLAFIWEQSHRTYKLNLWHVFRDYTFKITATHPGVNELTRVISVKLFLQHTFSHVWSYIWILCITYLLKSFKIGHMNQNL